MKKTALLSLLAVLSMTGSSGVLAQGIPSVDEIVKKSTKQVELEPTVDDFKLYLQETAPRYPHLVYKIYSGQSETLSSKGDKMPCYTLIALDPNSKKIRDFKIVSNIGERISSAVGSGILKFGSAAIDKISSPMSSEGKDLDEVNEANHKKDHYYIVDNAPSMPKTYEQDREVNKSLESSSGKEVGGYIKHYYREKNSFTKASTNFEGGVVYGGVSKSLGSISIDLEGELTPKTAVLSVGALGAGVKMSCVKLKPLEEVGGENEGKVVEPSEEAQTEEPDTYSKSVKKFFKSLF